MEKGKSDDCRCYGSPGKTQKPDSSSAHPSKPQEPSSACPPKPQEPSRPCCPCPCPAEKCKVTLRTVKTLINAENKDVELSELLGGITILEERRPKKKIIDMYDATSSTNRAEPDDVNPHYLAYIMSSIENGLSMKTDPIEVYEHLFSKGNQDAPLVALGPAAAISTEDMVVPLSAPTAVNWADPDMEDGARLENIGTRANVAVTEASSVSDADDLRVLLGGSSGGGGGGGGGGRSSVSVERQEDGGDPPPRDMLLETRAPTQSAAVLRGSAPPAWFPGFNVALPNTAQPALDTDPETVLDDAWFHSQPLALALDDKTIKLIGS